MKCTLLAPSYSFCRHSEAVMISLHLLAAVIYPPSPFLNGCLVSFYMFWKPSSSVISLSRWIMVTLYQRLWIQILFLVLQHLLFSARHIGAICARYCSHTKQQGKSELQCTYHLIIRWETKVDKSKWECLGGMTVDGSVQWYRHLNKAVLKTFSFTYPLPFWYCFM